MFLVTVSSNPSTLELEEAMKLFIVIVLLGVALARPQDSSKAQIARYDNDFAGIGNYRWIVETTDGFRREEIGEIKNQGTDNEILVIRGQYSYVGPDGVTYTVGYIADEEGYRAEGEHLPPAASVKSEPSLGIPSAALGSLVGGGLGK